MQQTSSQARRLDIIVFGATSFVGQILCRHLVSRHGTDGPLRWAIAGRSETKLQQVAILTGANVERIVADANDTTALRSLAQQSRVVVSTVGPYALYGSDLVAACVAMGTDYCDLTGEPQWMQQMIDLHSENATTSGARIIHACGFDSIPSDMGVWYTQQESMKSFGEHCSQIKMRVKEIKGSASGGTIASMMNVMEEVSKSRALRKVLANPYSLAPLNLRTGVKQPNVTVPSFDETAQEWVAPFVMASVNTRIVQRSHALLGRPWGNDFRYDEAMMKGEGAVGFAKATALAGGLVGFMSAAAVPPVRSLMSRYVLPKPGEGPSPEKQVAGRFDLRFYGITASKKTVVIKVTGDQDPGYGSTAKMLGEAADCLLELDRDSVKGGFWTPATALGSQLIDRLQTFSGMTFAAIETRT
jgi:short subunit dehydrogenase-like uncharacterized protein